MSNDGTNCPPLDETVDTDCDSREGLETQPISGITTLDLLGSAKADGVQLSLLELDDEEVAIMLTWFEGCYLGQEDFWEENAFAQVLRISLKDSIPKLKSKGPQIALGKTQEIPLSVSSDAPFVVEGYNPTGKLEAGSDEVGGFYVMTAGSEPRAVRISAFDGKLLDKNEEIAFGSSDETYITSLGPSSVLSHDKDSGTLNRLTFACQAPNSSDD